MIIEEILTPKRCHNKISVTSKTRLLSTISNIIATDNNSLDADTVFCGFVERERLGVTSLGKGVAIPHCKIAACTKITGSLITLENPIDFGASDGQPVDLIFALVAPNSNDKQHDNTLAEIAKLLNDDDFCFMARQTFDNEDLYNVTIMT